LNVTEVVVVTVLQAGMAWFQDKVVPARCKNIGHCWLTDITAQTMTMLLDQVIKGLDFIDTNQVIQLLA
jgi:hypothetical protein